MLGILLTLAQSTVLGSYTPNVKHQFLTNPMAGIKGAKQQVRSEISKWEEKKKMQTELVSPSMYSAH